MIKKTRKILRPDDIYEKNDEIEDDFWFPEKSKKKRKEIREELWL